MVINKVKLQTTTTKNGKQSQKLKNKVQDDKYNLIDLVFHMVLVLLKF